MPVSVSKQPKPFRTHRLIAENIYNGHISLLATGDQEFCELIKTEWLEKISDGRVKPKPGDTIYLAAVSEPVYQAPDFEYSVLGKSLT